MKTPFCIALAIAAAWLAGASTAAAASPPPNRVIETRLLNSEGAETGTVIITEAPKGVLISLDAAGLQPGWRAFHIHGTGDCSDHAQHFQKAGSHAARPGEAHGFYNADGPHMGDLPNIWVHEDGTAKVNFYTSLIRMSDLVGGDGAAVMIHAEADDYLSDPAGKSGTRLACGVIE